MDLSSVSFHILLQSTEPIFLKKLQSMVTSWYGRRKRSDSCHRGMAYSEVFTRFVRFAIFHSRQRRTNKQEQGVTGSRFFCLSFEVPESCSGCDHFQLSGCLSKDSARESGNLYFSDLSFPKMEDSFDLGRCEEVVCIRVNKTPR
jgi:hypothetical protein